ncbi:MAG: DUF1292 domain-containing protein [Clostridiales bacterium]|jgi:uncharacterized protein YrzB (UPF0473 family)|nr:DUF1292 domain-containing protein [Clostridiales bacterium]
MSELKNNQEADHSCGCGEDHDHDHEHHQHTVTIELETGEEMECPIIEIFEVNEKEYIALLHPEEEIAMLYGFLDYEDGSIELTEITSDEEYELVSKVFDTLFDEEDEEDEA